MKPFVSERRCHRPWHWAVPIVCLAVSVLLGPALGARAADKNDSPYVIPAPAGFIQENLARAKADLEEMKRAYKKRFGSLPDQRTQGFGKSIQDLAKSYGTANLAFEVSRPPVDWEGYISQSPDHEAAQWALSGGGQLFLLPEQTGISLEAPLGKPMSFATDQGPVMVFAADEKTRALLRLPVKAGIRINARAVLVTPGQPCCKSDTTRTKGECPEVHAAHQKAGEQFTLDPRQSQQIARELKFELRSGAGTLDDNLAAISFSRPGLSEISAVFAKTFDPIRSVGKVNVCGTPRVLSAAQWGREWAGTYQVAAYQSAGEKAFTARAVAVSVVALALEGHDPVALAGPANPASLPARDLFFGADPSYSHSRGQTSDYAGFTAPPRVTGVILKGVEDARLNEQVAAEALSRLTSTWSQDTAGPFVLGPKGEVLGLSGAGKGSRRLVIGREDAVITQDLTASTFRLDLPRTLDQGRIKPGQSYTVSLVVEGPADLSGAKAAWNAPKGLTWAKAATGFEQKETQWTASNSLVLDPASRNSGQAHTIEVSVTLTQGRKAFGLTRKLMETGPVIQGLALEAVRKGQGQIQTGQADLFFPNYLTQAGILLVPRAVLPEVGQMDLDKVGADAAAAQVVLKTDAPEIINLNGLMVTPRFSMGEANVTAAIGGRLLDPQNRLALGEEGLVSGAFRLTVNQLELLSGPGPRYTLRVLGPADMSKGYSAFFHGPTPFRSDFTAGEDGVWRAVYEGEGLEQVEIRLNGQAVALIQTVASRPAPLIQIQAIRPPISLVAHEDLGHLETETQCRDRMMQDPGFIGQAQGQDLYTAAKATCKQIRSKEKEKRKITEDLAKKGQSLVTIGSSVPVTAWIFNAPPGARCAWALINAGSLTLAEKENPVQDGTCANVIKGFDRSPSPYARVRVDLRHLAVPPAMAGAAVAQDNPPVKAGHIQYMINHYNR